MFLSSISLRNIRKHSNSRFDFTDKINYIVGGNGVGKTSVLEAVYYLSTTKSCVTSSDTEVVSLGKNDFSIQGNISGLTSDSIQINYSRTENKKNYILNSKQINKFSEVIGKFPVVLLSPADHTITQGFAADRRRFVDSVISQSSKTYLNLIFEYNRVLKQRAYLLNRIRENNFRKDSEIEAWNEKLVNTGIEIIKHRANFITEFETYVSDSYKRILSDNEIPEIYYYFLEDSRPDNLKECFNRLLKQREEDEFRRGINLVGPHKDEFVFKINDTSLKNYGSQGQHKTFQTVLRFAEYFYLKDKKANTPLFLLDDVFGELDSVRAKSISEYLSSVGQAIITLTDFGNISYLKKGNNDRIIKLSNDGEVTYA